MYLTQLKWTVGVVFDFLRFFFFKFAELLRVLKQLSYAVSQNLKK